jgi:hypothetical protein
MPSRRSKFLKLAQQLIGQGLGHVDQIHRCKRQIALGAILLITGLIDHRCGATQQVEYADQRFFEGVGRIGY